MFILFTFPNQKGPPCDGDGNTASVVIDNQTGQCVRPWVCEHRWPEIRALVHARYIANKNNVKWEISDWWVSGNKQVAFTVSASILFVFNTSETEINIRIRTSMACGVYCDINSGGMVGGKCVGYQIRVDEGFAEIKMRSETKMLFIHLSVRNIWTISFSFLNNSILIFFFFPNNFQARLSAS